MILGVSVLGALSKRDVDPAKANTCCLIIFFIMEPFYEILTPLNIDH